MEFLWPIVIFFVLYYWFGEDIVKSALEWKRVRTSARLKRNSARALLYHTQRQREQLSSGVSELVMLGSSEKAVSPIREHLRQAEQSLRAASAKLDSLSGVGNPDNLFITTAEARQLETAHQEVATFVDEGEKHLGKAQRLIEQEIDEQRRIATREKASLLKPPKEKSD